MPWFDLPLDQLRDYRTGTAEPPDLDLWWQRRLDEARATARPPVLARYETEIYAPVEVFDTEFSGAGGDRISLIQGVATAPMNVCCSRYS